MSDTTNFGFKISICSHSLSLNLSNRIRETEYQKPIINGNGNKYHDYDINRDNEYKYDDTSDRNSSVDDNDNNNDNNNNSRTNIDNNDNNNNSYIDNNNNNNNNSEESVTVNNCNILIIKLSNPNLKRSYQPEDTQENDLLLKLFSITLTELQPNTAYNLRMKIFYDMSESLESKRSRAFTTQPIKEPGSIPPSLFIPFIASFTLTSQEGRKGKKGEKGKRGEIASQRRKKKVQKIEIIESLSKVVRDGQHLGGLRASTGGYPYRVQLDFNSPVDEEGAPILGYQVWC